MSTAASAMRSLGNPLNHPLTCIEVGASSIETVLLESATVVHRRRGAFAPAGQPLLIAVPGLVDGSRVLAASNLDWYDVDAAEQLGLLGPADLVCNDAEAAALGESVLREGQPDLVFIGLGTGIGGAVVRGGRAVANLFAHGGRFGGRPCGCGRVGCLETVAAGWALPATLTDADVRDVASAVATAVNDEPLAVPPLLVLAGGLTTAYPHLVHLLGVDLPDRQVVPTAAPTTKSAAPWGLQYLYDTRTPPPPAVHR